MHQGRHRSSWRVEQARMLRGAAAAALESRNPMRITVFATVEGRPSIVRRISRLAKRHRVYCPMTRGGRRPRCRQPATPLPRCWGSRFVRVPSFRRWFVRRGRPPIPLTVLNLDIRLKGQSTLRIDRSTANGGDDQPRRRLRISAADGEASRLVARHRVHFSLNTAACRRHGRHSGAVLPSRRRRSGAEFPIVGRPP